MDKSLPAWVDRKHALLTRQYAVYTPPMDQMIEQVGDWLDQKQSGGYIYGASRFGKSRTIMWHLKTVLSERFEVPVPLVVWSRRPDSHKSERDFWKAILIASEFTFALEEKEISKTRAYAMCANRFVSVANNADLNYVVLVIDEAQGMTLQEWNWLVGLQNDLDRKGYLMTVFSIATHPMGYKHDYMAHTGNSHIAARFMLSSAQFHGLKSVEELGFALNGFDEDSEWPPESGVSFLRYFAKNDFDAGRRLANCANDLWNALIELAPENRKKAREFPMQHVAQTVESILKELARGRGWNEATSYKNLLLVLAKTNYTQHMHMISLGF